MGPWFQSDEDIKASVVVPLESKSTGFSAVGQYLQVTFGNSDLISVTWRFTKVGRGLLPLTQCSTIWLSDHMKTEGSQEVVQT